MRKRVSIRICGRVQGVGFRPMVYRHAVEAGVSGFVRNTASGVEIEVEGAPDRVDGFLRLLRERPPRQARVDDLRIEEIPPRGSNGPFRIESSEGSGDLLIGIPPDLALCDDCARELGDPADRRHQYPFINCTNCGPRFAIVEALPYDRPRTSMKTFEMCPACRAEYFAPADRRFEAQPIACPRCGPSIRLLKPGGVEVAVENPLAEAARLLRGGAILAVKGVGGYHLCGDAQNDRVVRLLRERKERPAKPLAVMFRDLAEVLRHAEADGSEQREMLDVSAPVVVLRRRPDSTLSPLVSPDTADVGAFLPYTPLHRLLLDVVSPLVMTSGNLAEEPIIKDEEELFRLMGPVADFALVHNRPIVRRCDDSVVRMVRGSRLFLRRSRGWVPGHVDLPLDGPPVLACGAELKSVFCVTRGRQAILSQHIGDLSEYASCQFYREAVEDLLRLLRIRPAMVAHDLHPDYESTRFAQSFRAKRRVAVQHHHAHVAACMAEHGLTGPVIGVALDGAGYGPDGSVWGGEFLVADYAGYRRAGHFKPRRLPGGEGAIRHPPRMALSWLAAEYGERAAALAAEWLPAIAADQRNMLLGLVASGAHSPWTSSAGRLFDAAAALLGLCDEITYEGQAAVRLQAAADPRETGRLPFELEDCNGTAVLSFGPALRALLEQRGAGAGIATLAARFHRTVAEGVCAVCAHLRETNGLHRVALSGGVFQNDLLLAWLTDLLSTRGFEVYSHHQVPPNDAGLALGQAAIALAMNIEHSSTINH